jgi:hypothetical protein
VFAVLLAMITALMSSVVVIHSAIFLQFGDTIVHLQGIEINGMLCVRHGIAGRVR